MKKLILIGILALLMISIASSQIELTLKDKLKNYADANFKTELKNGNIAVDSYEIQGNIIMIKLTTDGKKLRWITSKNNFNKIIK